VALLALFLILFGATVGLQAWRASTPGPKTSGEPTASMESPSPKPSISPQAAGHAKQLRAWLDEQHTLQCFPNLVTGGFLHFKGDWPTSKLVKNPIPLEMRFEADERLPPSMRGAEIEGVGKDVKYGVDLQNVSAAVDASDGTVAISHGGYEYFELLLLSRASTPPLFVGQRALHVAILDGFTIGSERSDVESYFGYDGQQPAQTKACGLVLEQFGTTDPDFDYTFVFLNDQLVALDYTFFS
jgi:hypothetical protein